MQIRVYRVEPAQLIHFSVKGACTRPSMVFFAVIRDGFHFYRGILGSLFDCGVACVGV
ncbi:hypothetical protein ACFL0D_01865 [Thermoproteota archaeon]